MTRPPPTSTLFPYTTLFRSTGTGVNGDVIIEYPVEARLRQLKGRVAMRLLVVEDDRSLAEAIVFNRSEEHTSELQSQSKLVCRPLLEKKNRTDAPAPRSSGC